MLVMMLLVNKVDCRSHCNMSSVAAVSGVSPSQRPVVVSSVALVDAGFIQVDRSPTGRCPHQKSCSVTLRAAPGQRVNITLWDFTRRDDQRVVARHKNHGVATCYR